jgi:hypothetical protein
MPKGDPQSLAEFRKLVRSGRSLLKRKAGEKPFAEWWAEYKAEERELEERKWQRYEEWAKRKDD